LFLPGLFVVVLPDVWMHGVTASPTFAAADQGQQRERQKQSMGVVDRAMYKFGQLVFGSQSVRLFTFVYLLVLHLLVFGSLMRMTHHSSNQLYEHQQSVLDSRHDAMGVLHHEKAAAATRLP
jgi:hypothetical protein